MAIKSTVTKKTLQLISNGGVDAAGDKITAKKSFSGINQAASDSQIYTGAKAIHTLYSGSLEKVVLNIGEVITEEEA